MRLFSQSGKTIQHLASVSFNSKLVYLSYRINILLFIFPQTTIKNMNLAENKQVESNK
jgi:hypothetical protein